MEGNNITLIGMPAVGKSTVGVILAKILGYRFIDADIMIQEREQRLLSEIIEEDGVDGFIAIENTVNRSIEAERSIIATGGSVIYGKEAMKHLRRISTVIYLKVDFDTLSSRLGNIKNRGVVLREGQTLKDLYLERTPLYEKYAHLTIEEFPEDTAEETIEKIIAELNQ